jgi:hypothetical protein
MNARVFAVVGFGLAASFAAFAQEVSHRVTANWPAAPYGLPSGVLPAESARAGEDAEEAAVPGVARALPLTAIAPCRLLDTRAAGLPGLTAGVAQEIEVAGRCGIPAEALGVSVRVALVDAPVAAVVTMAAAEPGRGDGVGADRLVLDAPQASASAGVVALGADGLLIAVTDAGTVHLIADVNGYYAPEPAVRSLNALEGDVVLRAGKDLAITAEGSTVTIGLAPGGSAEDGLADEAVPPSYASLPVVRRIVGSPATAPAGKLPPAKALAPPSSSVYFAGALGLPNTAATGEGVLTLGGDRFLHNYGPASYAGNTFLGEGAGNFTMGGAADQGMYNTGVGSQALASNTSGSYNTASGLGSLVSNTLGSGNTASGYKSLYSSSEGTANTAIGLQSLLQNTEGHFNAAIGYNSLANNTTGDGNTGGGSYSLFFSSTGNDNTASGINSLYLNTAGSENTAIGSNAGYANTTGNNNTFLGADSDASANNLSNATAIGYQATVDVSNKVRVGNSSVTVIEGQVAWSYASDARLKEAIRDLELGLDFVMRLRPVAFRMKQGNGRTDMGFLAQDIEALVGDGYNLVVIGQDAERSLSLRATDLIAPLVKAVQEQQLSIEEQRGLIETLQARLDRLERELEALRAAPALARTQPPTGL